MVKFWRWISKTLLFVFIIGSLWVAGSWFLPKISVPVLALDEIESLQKEIDELEERKRLSENATKPLEGELQTIEAKIASARNGIWKAKNDATQLEEDIGEREENLGDQIEVFKTTVYDQYLVVRTQNVWELFFSPRSFNERIKEATYQNRVQSRNSEVITEIGDEIKQLNEDKVALEERQKTLATMQAQLNSQADFFKIEIDKAKDYQKELTTKIAELSAQQQAIINARSGSQTTAVGDVAMADDFNASIGYKEQAPGGSFAVFSFGAYTHRNGMSQYGARARAQEGQSVEEILKAYYPNARLEKNYSAMGEIEVDGYGRISFEDKYLQGIAEMPSSWPLEALKAQAIAARTYAIRSTDNGSRSICTTEACQVYNGGHKGGDWEKAVNETKGWVLVDEGSGQPVSTQYASTHGGYAKTSGWDTTDKSGDGDWANRAWENKANSPWFYKAWYRSGYSSSGANCGRNHPWLNQEEMADILNAWIVRQNPNGADSGRILPVTIKDCSVGGNSGEPYSMSELRDLANNSGGAVTSISSVHVSHNNEGQTSQVRFSTNRGDVSLSGSDFKTIFNLRAPGYLRIPQSSFVFINIEHKS